MSGPHADAVRQRHIDALVRRSLRHQGAARRVIDERVQQLQAAQGREPGPTRPAAQPEHEARPSPLVDLLAHLARHGAAGQRGPGASAPAELKAVSLYRGTWARLAVERRLSQSLAKVPDNAGPLNTQRLLHQAMTVMRDASPLYLQHFLSHAEALLWLNHVSPGTAALKK